VIKKPLHWFLVGSLALNLFLIGVVGAYQLRGHGIEPRALRSPLRIEEIAETLPRADAARLEAVFRAHEAEIAEYSAAIRQAQNRERDGFRAQPFDRAAVAASMAEARFNHDAAKRVIHDVIIEAAQQMSPQGRAKLAEWASPPVPDAAR
jgi:uncharacterized membrane protein